MRHLELFSGIGGFRRAMDLLTQDGVMPFECVGFSEIDDKAIKTYKANFGDNPNEIEMGDIVSFVSDKQQVYNLPSFDLLTGGFPCQTFSMMGKQMGFKDEDRGQMFFRILDVVDVKGPTYLLLENVKNLLTHDNGNTYSRIERELTSRGYHVFPNVFNTVDFGLPQKRSRILIFATKGSTPKKFRENYTPEIVAREFKENPGCSVALYDSTLDILKKNVDQKYYLSERIKPTILADGSANFKSNSEINLKIARPLTASMHKMHRACQDNYYSQDWIDSDGLINPVNTCSKEELAGLSIRKLTPQEAFMLQGFPEDFAEKANKVGVPDGALYKQAGNAVSVNVIYAVLRYLINHKAIK